MAINKKASIIALLIVTISVLAFKAPDNKYFEIARNLDIFATLFKEVNAYYVDEIDPEELVSTGIHAMLASLDPYTTYIPEEHLEDYRTMTTGLYGGIGAVVGTVNNKTVITMLYEGYGAHKAGLKIGDQIIQIDRTEIGNKETGAATELLKGQPGSSLLMKVLRNNDEEISFTFDRETIRIENVPFHKIISADVGYIRLSDFTLGASREVEQAVKDLKKEGANKLIIDLRGNPGGLLSEAINVSNLFIPRGKEVVSTKGKVEEWNKIYKGLNQPLDKDIPMVVLINNSSASAAEIVAGVIQDYDRGVLIGRRTFGKGLVQATRPLSYNSQLKVTTAKYYIPSGRCIQAIDYAERNADGDVSLISDSLKVAFKTENNRTVYDGGGLQPDISVAGNEWSVFAMDVMRAGVIFNFANTYYHSHESISEPDIFDLSDQDYNIFVEQLENTGFDFSSSIESIVDELVSTVNDEEMSQEIIDKVHDIKRTVGGNVKQEFIDHKDEIRRLLRQEIVSRYYFNKGSIQGALVGDRDLKSAIDILSDTKSYNEILSK
jgi:carboxyl-terminal processing protease